MSYLEEYLGFFTSIPYSSFSSVQLFIYVVFNFCPVSSLIFLFQYCLLLLKLQFCFIQHLI